MIMDPGFQGQIFSQALNFQKPWYINDIKFRREERRLDIRLNFERGAKFACPDCAGEECHIHDTVEKEWKHLDFFQVPKHTSIAGFREQFVRNVEFDS